VIITPLNTTHINISCKLSIKMSFYCFVIGDSSSLAVGPRRKPHNVTKYRCSCSYNCNHNQVDIESHLKVFDPGKSCINVLANVVKTTIVYTLIILHFCDSIVYMHVLSTS